MQKQCNSRADRLLSLESRHQLAAESAQHQAPATKQHGQEKTSAHSTTRHRGSCWGGSICKQVTHWWNRVCAGDRCGVQVLNRLAGTKGPGQSSVSWPSCQVGQEFEWETRRPHRLSHRCDNPLELRSRLARLGDWQDWDWVMMGWMVVMPLLCEQLHWKCGGAVL